MSFKFLISGAQRTLLPEGPEHLSLPFGLEGVIVGDIFYFFVFQFVNCDYGLPP